MATTNGNRKILDLKRWEMVTPAPTATSIGVHIASARDVRQHQLLVQSATSAFLYNPQEDSWIATPSPALTGGTFGAGTCGVAGNVSTGATVGFFYLTALGGNTTSINTNLTLARDLRGYSVHFMGGTNGGKTKVIASNDVGPNATIRFEGAAELTAFDNTSNYRLMTPVWYVMNGGAVAANSFKKYDFATNSWIDLGRTGFFSGSLTIDGRLAHLPSWIEGDYKTFASGTATAAGAATISNSAKTWATNQWALAYQVRITGGTGAGQVRSILSNTATQITVSSNWTPSLSTDSQYSIEANEDFIYFLGNNAVAMYRYSISANAWTLLSPAVARAAAPLAGMSGHIAWNVTDPAWNIEINGATGFLNGRRLYSFRGGAGANLDYYDIPSNSWVSSVTYSPATEVFGAGTKWVYKSNFLYSQKDATGRWFRYNIPTSEMEGWGTMTYTQGAAVIGDTAFPVTYKDGATEIDYVYMLLNTSTVMLRQMVI